MPLKLAERRAAVQTIIDVQYLGIADLDYMNSILQLHVRGDYIFRQPVKSDQQSRYQ